MLPNNTLSNPASEVYRDAHQCVSVSCSQRLGSISDEFAFQCHTPAYPIHKITSQVFAIDSGQCNQENSRGIPGRFVGQMVNRPDAVLLFFILLVSRKCGATQAMGEV
jgi:hypothetical protein